jgi:hypothetical protein
MTATIEQFAPELEKIISTYEPIRALAEGFGGPQGPAEGPLWWKVRRYLLFSDIHNNRRMKYVPGQGVSLFLEPTNRANGLTRDLQGRLSACAHDTRRVTRLELDGSLTVLANSFKGQPSTGRCWANGARRTPSSAWPGSMMDLRCQWTLPRKIKFDLRRRQATAVPRKPTSSATRATSASAVGRPARPPEETVSLGSTWR